MKEPSERDIKKEKQSELDKIAKTNAKCVSAYQVIRNNVFNNIFDGDLAKMNKYIYSEYGKVYTGLKGMIIDALNDSKDKNVKLVEKLLDEKLPPARHYKVIPNDPAFKWTNRVFTEKSVSVRSQKAADAITKIIADGRNDGLAIKDIQKKIDIVMGFRDAQGKYTDKSKKLIESGKFAHRNGSIYETYRIARTEVMRMNAFAKYDQFDELRLRYPNARLKLLATLDDRTREQSREMNGQISNAKGEFLYPDSKYYRLGTAPAQWCINDRETCTIVFLTDKEAKENREELKELKEELQQDLNNQNMSEKIQKTVTQNNDIEELMRKALEEQKQIQNDYTEFDKKRIEYNRKWLLEGNAEAQKQADFWYKKAQEKYIEKQEYQNIVAQKIINQLNNIPNNLEVKTVRGLESIALETQNNLNKLINKNIISDETIPMMRTFEERSRFIPSKNVIEIDDIALNRKEIGTTLHESMHWLEHNNKNILDKSVAFLEYRTEGEVAKKLSEITGFNYKDTEIAKKDRFFSPYVGKIYKHSNGEYWGTEILSMGVEELYNHPLDLYKNDKEYFNFIIAVLRNQL